MHQLHQLSYSRLHQRQETAVSHTELVCPGVVLRDYSHHPVGDLLSELHWLPVESRISFKLACLIYDILSTSQPNYLQFLYYTAHCILSLVTQHLLEQHQVSTEFGKQSFSYLIFKT